MVTQYFGPTTADASTQGAEQADQAVTAAQGVGINSGVIYTDIENYTVNSTCSPLVQAYVDGFVSEMHLAHSGYLAGVYANAGPVNSDISMVSPPPDDIWITKTPATGHTPQVTIWNQGISDNLWPNNQRIHQFLIDQANVTFGNQPLKIDEDIVNATFASASSGKTYNWNFAPFSYPGSSTTQVYGIQ